MRTSQISITVGLFVLLTSLSWAADPKMFEIVVQRESTKDGLVTGSLSVNGEVIGKCYENDDKKIPTGSYKGLLRTTSGKNFVQGPGGKLGKSGDFLLEVAEVKEGTKKRTDILFHAGNKSEHSEGCILCGPAPKDKDDTSFAPETLKKLRLLFYDGEDRPSSTPNKTITITVKAPK